MEMRIPKSWAQTQPIIFFIVFFQLVCSSFDASDNIKMFQHLLVSKFFSEQVWSRVWLKVSLSRSSSFTLVSICTVNHAQGRLCTHKHKHTCTRTRTHQHTTHTHTRTNTNTQTHKHTNTNTHTHTRARTHTHILWHPRFLHRGDMSTIPPEMKTNRWWQISNAAKLSNLKYFLHPETI